VPEPIAFPRSNAFPSHDYSGLESSVLAALPQSVIMTDLDGRITFWNEAAEKLYGWRGDEVIGRNILEVTPTADSAADAKDIISRLKAGERWVGDFQVRHKDGHWFLANVVTAPVYDHSGTLMNIMGVSQPAATDLASRAAAFLKSVPLLLRNWMRDEFESFIAVDWEKTGIGLFLFCAAVLARVLLDNVVPARLPFVTFYPATVLTAFYCGPAIGILSLLASMAAGTFWVVPPAGSDPADFRLSSAIVFLITSGLNIVLILYLRGLQQRMERRDAQLALVNRELKHRMQNALTIASSISVQTVQSAIPRDELPKAITSRIQAVSAAQDLIDPDPSKGVDLMTLVDRLLKPLCPEQPRLIIAGDSVLLPGRVATSFALILHELGTNALKYGAWQAPDGVVTVAWAVRSSELDFRWQEYQRQSISIPVKQGYGSVLIKNGLPEAEVSHQISQNGVDCRIQLHL
jgi:PAS domain S-box-containing protein